MNTLQYPPSIDWEVTSSCNHACIHCYNYWRQQAELEQYEKPKNESFFTKIAEKIVESKPVSVQITGGEPLIVWDKIKTAIILLLDNDINVSINTNATYVTDESAEFLAKHKISAFISLPCVDEKIFDKIAGKAGAQNRAIIGIQKLIRHHVDVSLNMVVTKKNFPYVFETAKFAKEKFGVRYFSATKASFPQNADGNFKDQLLSCDEFNQMLDSLIRVKKELGMRIDSAWVYSLCGMKGTEHTEEFGMKRRCGCGRYNFVVDATGAIKACGCDTESFGNILADPFEKAIAKMEKWQNGILLATVCKTCKLLKYCGGGCRSDSMSMYGNYEKPDSTANVENRKNIFVEDTCEFLPENAIYKLNPNVKQVEESFGIRLSYKTNYAYLTTEFAEFLNCGYSFSIKQLQACCGQGIKEVNKCMQILIKKKILQPYTGENRVELVNSYFELLAIPYCNKNATQMQKDYADNAHIIKRYSV